MSITIISRGSRKRLVQMQRDLLNKHSKFYGGGEGNQAKRFEALHDFQTVTSEYKKCYKPDDSAVEHQSKLALQLKGGDKRDGVQKETD